MVGPKRLKPVAAFSQEKPHFAGVSCVVWK